MPQDDRPTRMCDTCGGVDTAPRHVIGLGPDDPNPTAPDIAQAALKAAGTDNAGILAQVMDTSTQVKHMDCCRADGCPDGSCDEVTAGAEKLRGTALLKHITKES